PTEPGHRGVNGIEIPSIDHPAREVSVSIDAAVTEKRPITPDFFEAAQGTRYEQHFLPLVRNLPSHAAQGSADERAAPKLEAAVQGPLVSDAVDRGHINAVGDGVRPLHELPGLVLRRPKFRLLARVPADGRRVEEDGRALKCG